jgi:hypothetical protein
LPATTRQLIGALLGLPTLSGRVPVDIRPCGGLYRPRLGSCVAVSYRPHGQMVDFTARRITDESPGD